MLQRRYSLLIHAFNLPHPRETDKTTKKGKYAETERKNNKYERCKFISKGSLSHTLN